MNEQIAVQGRLLEKRIRSQSFQQLLKDIWACRSLFLMLAPAITLLILFSYIPMTGIVLAFKKWDGKLGIYGSPWIGFKNFQNFFASRYALRIIRNAVLLHILGLVFSFPVPIILALMLNEVLQRFYKRTVQTISYFPHFIAPVVMVGILKMLFGPDPNSSVANQLWMRILGGELPINFLAERAWFRPLYIGMGIWQGSGFGAIIYLAALSAVDVSVHEAAIIDGANRWQLIRHVNIPAIMPTIIILLILNLSGLIRAGLETILLMYGPTTYEVADVIETFVYRRGIMGDGGAPDFAFATAVGLFQSLVGMALLVLANTLARRVSETSLW